MNEILDAILAPDTTSADFAGLTIPESYRAVTVHKDEAEMFAGLESKVKDPASRCTSTRCRCPSWARARRWWPSWPPP